MGKFFETILIQPLFNLLMLFVIWLPGHSLGWAIVALTVLIRLLLVPSAAQSIRQQHKMKILQPELKEVQERHKNDRTAQAEAMMALYKKYDIHPLGSCLPMLIQLPILFGLFYALRDGIGNRFDLLYSFVPQPETVNQIFFGINLSQPNILLAVVAGALQFWQTRMLTQSPQAHQPEGEMQKILNTQLLYIMPVMTVVISVTLPAALPLYWATATLFAVAQQWFLFRTMPQPVTIAKTAAPSAELPGKKGDAEQRGNVSVRIRKKG